MKSDDQPKQDKGKTGETTRRLLADYQEAVCQIVALRERVREEAVDFNELLRAVAQAVQSLTHASAVGIAILVGDELVYRTAVGLAARAVGHRVALASVPWQELTQSGAIGTLEGMVQGTDGNAIWSGRGAQSFLAIPLYRAFTAAGFLELLFADRYRFEEADIQALQLMAGIVSEILNRESLRKLRIIRKRERARFLAAYELVRKKFPAAAKPGTQGQLRPAS
jgi:transcriptional regulator with GAF, ATPase, and Fis domain